MNSIGAGVVKKQENIESVKAEIIEAVIEELEIPIVQDVDFYAYYILSKS